MIPRDKRSFAAFGHDVVAALAAWCGAFWLRFNLEVPEFFVSSMLHTLGPVVVLQAAIFLGLGLYRGIWRYASMPDLSLILFAASLGTMTISMIVLIFRIPDVPRSVLLLYPLLLVLIMGGSRLAYRAWKERAGNAAVADGAKPVLVLGAGDAASDLLKHLARSTQWRVVGLLDDSAAKQRRQIHGVTVLGPLASLGSHALQRGARHAIIAMPGSNHSARRHAAALCAAAGVQALTVPSFEDIASGKVTVSQIRSIELDDLLGRDPVRLDSSGLTGWLQGRTVLVTGAGGSIGAELCRQIARFGPAMLVMVEHNEFALYRIAEEFLADNPSLRHAAVIADVKNEVRLQQVFRHFRPAVVFHAAAYKHVPLMEGLNAWEAVQNNVAGTLTAARTAAAAGVDKFVLISTDKAVNPTNVMGATKRLAELVCLNVPAGATRFVTVRFGNVLGSAGSVIPKFREQIAKGGPITVTHPEIQRFFMSIPEAAQLVLQAGLMGQGREIFVLDMGEPVRIVDLAQDLIRLSGFSEQEIRIEFTGLRPGEKLYEELLADDELTLPTPHPKLRIAQAAGQMQSAAFAGLLDWLSHRDAMAEEAVRTGLVRFIPEYNADPAQGESVASRSTAGSNP